MNMKIKEQEAMKEMLFALMQCDESDKKLFDVFMHKLLWHNIHISYVIAKAENYITRDLDLHCFCEALAECLEEDYNEWI